jgi:hypothetical protein
MFVILILFIVLSSALFVHPQTIVNTPHDMAAVPALSTMILKSCDINNKPKVDPSSSILDDDRPLSHRTGDVDYDITTTNDGHRSKEHNTDDDHINGL